LLVAGLRGKKKKDGGIGGLLPKRKGPTCDAKPQNLKGALKNKMNAGNGELQRAQKKKHDGSSKV